MNSFNELLTIVTITKDNPEELALTLRSCDSLIKYGAHLVIQNGGESIPVKLGDESKIKIYDEIDNGIYDALNKGIAKVQTSFFLLLHSGDEFVGCPRAVLEILQDLKNTNALLSLNALEVFNGKFKRTYSSLNWSYWMFGLGVQPPHLATLYSIRIRAITQYRTDLRIVSDFVYLRSLLKNCKYIKSGERLVKMNPGGASTSGILSYVAISNEFVKIFGLKGFLWSFTRLPIKLFLTK